MNTGDTFGRLTVIDAGLPKRFRRATCVCTCGSIKTFLTAALTRSVGSTKSCGCLVVERGSAVFMARNTTHNQSKTPTYRIWAGMVSRCGNANTIGFHNYGGRGIQVCDRWLSFDAFVADMGPRPEGKTLGRRDNDGNYEPSNCRWETAQEQQRNKRTTRLLDFDGKRLCLQDWSALLGIHQSTLSDRLRSGWSTASALTTPVRRLRTRGGLQPTRGGAMVTYSMELE